MAGEIVAFVGSCQANALASLYRVNLAPAREQLVHFVRVKAAPSSADRSNLETADIVVLQEFDFPVGFVKLVKELCRPAVPVHTFPMVAAGWLWPFAGQPHPRNEALPFEPRGGPYPGELGDRFLNRMLLEGVGETEALDRYAGLNPKQDLHLDRLIEIQLRRQRRRDLNTGFAVTELIEANFRSQRLFLTQNHPDLFVFRAVARGLFDKLGLSLGEVDFVLKRLRVSPLSAAAAPIHPSIAAHFGIEWAGPTARYPYFGEGSFTFEQYVRRYMRFEWNSELHQALGTPLSNASASVLETLNRGLAISPGSAQGFRRKAAVLSRLGRGVEATEAALCAIELEPDAPAGHVALVSVYLHRNCLAEAEIVARRAIALDPDHAPAHQLLAESLRRTAKTTWALHMDRRAQFWPSPLP